MKILEKESFRDEILNFLKKNNIQFKHFRHQSAFTSVEAVNATGISKEKGIKSLILKGKKTGNHYLVAILGHQKLDMKAFASIVCEKCELESLEKVNELYGLEQGGVSPFGSLLGLRTFFDQSILAIKDECIMACGLSTESIMLPGQDLVKVVKPEIVQIAK